MRPDYYISRVTLEKLISGAEEAIAKLIKLGLYSEADTANDMLQALKELHEHTYGSEGRL